MFRACLGFSLLLASLQAAAQTTAPGQNTQSAPPPVTGIATPSDPAQHLDVGRKVNGLVVPGAKPWHLKATYQLYDEKGKPAETGTYEEWWFGPRQYRVAYHSPSFNQEEYGTEKGVFRTGDQGWVPWPASEIRDEIESPIEPDDYLPNPIPQNMDRKLGSKVLPCIGFAGKHQKHPEDGSKSYCFNVTQPALRYANSNDFTYQTSYNRLVVFDNHFTARIITTQFIGIDALSVQVEDLESLQPQQDSLATPPADALPGPRRVLRLPVSDALKLLQKTAPDYPPGARSNGISGTVIVVAHTDTSGHVVTAQAVAGQSMLRTAGVNAVRNWRYTPPRINGNPVEVEIQVKVIFALVE